MPGLASAAFGRRFWLGGALAFASSPSCCRVALSKAALIASRRDSGPSELLRRGVGNRSGARRRIWIDRNFGGGGWRVWRHRRGCIGHWGAPFACLRGWVMRTAGPHFSEIPMADSVSTTRRAGLVMGAKLRRPIAGLAMGGLLLYDWICRSPLLWLHLLVAHLGQTVGAANATELTFRRVKFTVNLLNRFHNVGDDERQRQVFSPLFCVRSRFTRHRPGSYSSSSTVTASHSGSPA